MSDSIEVNPGAATSAIGTINRGGNTSVEADTLLGNAIKKLDGMASGDAKNAALDLNNMLQRNAADFEATRAQMVTTANRQMEEHISIDRSRGGAVRSI